MMYCHDLIIEQKIVLSHDFKSEVGARDWTRTSTHEAYAPKAYVYTNFTTRACGYYITGLLNSIL